MKLTKQQLADLRDLREVGCRVDLADLARRLDRGEEPAVSQTPSGRDIRMVRGGYLVQPRNDNYWLRVQSLDEALDAYENPAAYR